MFKLKLGSKPAAASGQPSPAVEPKPNTGTSSTSPPAAGGSSTPVEVPVAAPEESEGKHNVQPVAGSGPSAHTCPRGRPDDTVNAPPAVLAPAVNQPAAATVPEEPVQDLEPRQIALPLPGQEIQIATPAYRKMFEKTK